MAMDLQKLLLNDRGRIEDALSATRALRSSPLSLLAFAPHFIWQRQFTYLWTITGGWVVVFAEYADGIYMPLPPLGPAGLDRASAPYMDILMAVFDFMNGRNGGTAVTRIENIPEELKSDFEQSGCRLSLKDPDYLYRTEELIALKGDRYKSQRAAYNQLVRSRYVDYQEYALSDRVACLSLLDRWIEQKRQSSPHRLDPDAQAVSRAMLEDARDAHEEVLSHSDELGLIGRVVKIGNTVCGYTFGYPRNAQVFCVLVEVTDRGQTGLAQYLFRELCRECSNYAFINTMDDSGLAGLARSKRAYHPHRFVPNYVATMV